MRKLLSLVAAACVGILIVSGCSFQETAPGEEKQKKQSIARDKQEHVDKELQELAEINAEMEELEHLEHMEQSLNGEQTRESEENAALNEPVKR